MGGWVYIETKTMDGWMDIYIYICAVLTMFKIFMNPKKNF